MNMQSSLYVMGNLCLQTPSQISQGIDPTLLVVKGWMSLEVNTNVGADNAPIAEAHVAGGCSYKGAAFHSPLIAFSLRVATKAFIIALSRDPSLYSLRASARYRAS